MTRTPAVLLLPLCLILLLPLNAQAQSPRVMTSLHPIALLTAEIAGDEMSPEALVPAGGSPHTYSLRPSERRKLQQAELFIWVGPGMELFLQRVMQQPELAGKSVQLSRILAGPMASHEDHREAETHDDHDHGHHHESDAPVIPPPSVTGDDPHLWLDPGLAIPLAKHIAKALKTLDGVDAERIETNLKNFEHRLEETLNRLHTQLAPAREMAIFTYHDAFRRYAEYFDLNIAGYLTLNPEQSPGARGLSQLRERLQQEDIPCVMTEPQFSKDWWHGISNGMSLGLSVWDPMGSDIAVAQGGYLAFLEQLAERVLACRAP